MNGTLAVARYTLIELSRRRILLVLFIIGAVGIALIGGALKLISVTNPSSVSGGFGPPGSVAPDPALFDRVTELQFVSQLIDVVGFFALLIAFAIGMTAIYHDLESGAAVGIFSKPVSRFAFTAGKVIAALVAMIVIVGLLSIETRLAMSLFGGGLEGALWVETLAAVANAALLMLVVLTLSTWMNNIIAAVVAFIYNVVTGVITFVHNLADNGVITRQRGQDDLRIVPSLAGERRQAAVQRRHRRRREASITSSGPQTRRTKPWRCRLHPASGDILWWAFVVCFFAGLVYYAVRRRQV